MFDFCQITKNSCTPERKSFTRLTLIEVFQLHVRVFPRIDGKKNGKGHCNGSITLLYQASLNCNVAAGL